MQVLNKADHKKSEVLKVSEVIVKLCFVFKNEMKVCYANGMDSIFLNKKKESE